MKLYFIKLDPSCSSLTAGPDYMRFFIFYKRVEYELLNMLKILSNLNNFHSLEVVNRVRETQFQAGENSN